MTRTFFYGNFYLQKVNKIDKVILTASEVFFKIINQTSNIKPRKALNHPNWKMGKISLIHQP